MKAWWKVLRDKFSLYNIYLAPNLILFLFVDKYITTLNCFNNKNNNNQRKILNSSNNF